MARVGLIGGLGPESTIDYYRRIIQVWQETAPGSAPMIVIDSLDVDHGIRLVQSDRGALVEYLVASAGRLAGAGVDFIAITANTAHIVFDEVAARTTLPLLSIVEVCAAEAALRGYAKVGLLGTRFTMEAPFYTDVFAKRSIEVIAPVESDRVWLHERYIGELLRGQFTDATREGVLQLVRTLRESAGIDAIVFGGTELPLLLNAETVEGIPTLDTTELHVRAIVQQLRAL
jgi:aspartate racemase